VTILPGVLLTDVTTGTAVRIKGDVSIEHEHLPV
jgi:hypothetical protein